MYGLGKTNPFDTKFSVKKKNTIIKLFITLYLKSVANKVMKVYSLNIPDTKGLTNVELEVYARKLRIKNFRGVYMRDNLPKTPYPQECGIMNLNTSHQPGSHWVCYYKDNGKRIYFDSFGQITPIEIQKYLKTKEEYEMKKPVIQRNTISYAVSR